MPAPMPALTPELITLAQAAPQAAAEPGATPAGAPAPTTDVAQTAGEVAQALANDPAGTAERYLAMLQDWVVTKGPGVVAALLLLAAAWFLSRWARRLVITALTNAKVDLLIAKFFGNIVKWILITLAVIALLGTFGINTTGFAAILGAVGLAVGLALQGNLGNLASGVLLLIFRPFKIGDAVIVAGQAGVVDGIDLFTTNLDTGDNRRIIIPNGAIFSGVIENQTHHAVRRVAVSVQIAGTASIAEAEATLLGIVQKVASGTPGVVASPPPSVGLVDLGPDPNVTWSVGLSAQTAAFGVVREALLRELKTTLDERGLSNLPPVQWVKQIQ